MFKFNNNLVSDLAKKYTFETFDFKNNSPEKLFDYYQEVYIKINGAIEQHNLETDAELERSIEDFL